MKKAPAIVIGILLTAFVSLYGQEADEMQFSSYDEMRAHIGKLYQKKDYAEAARILEWALTQYPDRIEANAFNLALMYMQLKEHDKAVKALEYGLAQGIWFGKYAMGAEIWTPLRDNERFRAFIEKNEAKRHEAQDSVEPKLDVCVPGDFDEGKTYPLFIALHGGGENIEGFKPQWTSDVMKEKFIVAYPQSSQMVSMTGFSWTEDIEISKQEIRKAFERILEDFPIDPSRVVIGGFSSGGVASLAVVLDETFPVMGFVILCPAKPDNFSAENVRKAKDRGIRGTLITTEMDPRVPDQKEMVAIMEAEGLDHEFVITPNIGHWYPDNLSQLIDAAIAHIIDARQ